MPIKRSSLIYFCILLLALFVSGTPLYSQSTQTFSTEPNPLQISEMRRAVYPGSGITIESTVVAGLYYNQYVASYQSNELRRVGAKRLKLDDFYRDGDEAGMPLVGGGITGGAGSGLRGAGSREASRID